jgi:ATP-binding cassette subfamily B multidrug efflux pump
MTPKPPTSNLSPFLRPYLKYAILAPLFMFAEVSLDLMQPRLLQHIVDEGIARGDLTLVSQTGIWMVVLAFLGVGAGMGCTVFSVLAAQGFGTDLRRALFAKVQNLSFGNLDSLESGSLITRLTNDVSQVQEVVMLSLRVMVRVPLMLIGSIIMAIVTSPRLAMLFLPLVPIVTIIMVVIIRKSYPLFSQVQERLDRVNITLQENLAGVRVVKAFARQDHEKGRFEKANTALTNKNIEVAIVGATTMPLMMLALNSGIIGTLWMGGLGVTKGTVEVGQIIAFINYLTQTLFSLMMVSMLIVRLSRAQASSVRIGELMDSEPLIQSKASPQTPVNPRGHVVFDNVSFAYEDGEPTLCHVSFEAKPGETIAILGATGAGKSTLVQLIPRFYDVTEGRVLLDGIDVRDWDLNALRQTVAIALQESVLFSGTIRDNIAYGRPEATDEEILAAAKASQADEFISRLPDGYATVVGARGVNLSGGQKQRIAIARALILQSPLLILDDSTSAVDVTTEARIQSALGLEHKQQTRIIVAQRISTVIGADQILVLEDGEIASRGTHEELMESSPIYREIYQSQMENGVIVDEVA